MKYDLSKLPVNNKLFLRFLDKTSNRRAFGPTGDCEFGGSWDEENPKLWHATITPIIVCESCCSEKERLWFRGHGHSADEAIQEAWDTFQAAWTIYPDLYPANVKPTEAAPPAGGKP